MPPITRSERGLSAWWRSLSTDGAVPRRRKTRSVELRLSSRELDRPRAYAALIRAILTQLVALNVVARKRGDVPELYQSGVRFRREPRGVETFRDAPNVFRVGHGDCAHLAAWRVADLRLRGERAALAVRARWTKRAPRRRVFHVMVRRQSGALEDPSAILSR